MTTNSYFWLNSKKEHLSLLAAILEDLRLGGKKIVTTNGCFDLIHAGHVDFLNKAKEQGDILVVGINSDDSVKRIKGQNRPIISEQDRADTLAALRSVDHVVVFDGLLPNDFIELAKPHIHCKGGDYLAEGLPEGEIVRKHGGEVRILPLKDERSSSKIIEQILLSDKKVPSKTVENSEGDPTAETLEFFLMGSNILRQTGYRISEQILMAAEIIADALLRGNKVLICGNGGSAADSQHFAAELVVRYKRSRKALPAFALTTDSSILTASGNDFGFEQIFSRQLEAFGNHGDILLAISTSGNSSNIIVAAKKAKDLGLRTIGLTGSQNSQLVEMSDLCLQVPSTETPFIQQSHIAILHRMCDLIERKFEQK